MGDLEMLIGDALSIEVFSYNSEVTDQVYGVIKMLGEAKENDTCAFNTDIAKKLGWALWKDLWRERKVYFKTYYYPLKILEKLKMIEYGARSTTRLI